MSEQMKLRGHHLLCLMAFRGKGYNSEFTQNLKNLQERIKKEKDFKIKIVNGPDDICSSCPHLKGSACSKGEDDNNQKICSMDIDILKKLNLNQIDVEIEFSTIIKALEKLEKDEIRTLCSSCDWLETEDCPQAIRLFIHSFSI